jgi:TPR repeat protein
MPVDKPRALEYFQKAAAQKHAMSMVRPCPCLPAHCPHPFVSLAAQYKVACYLEDGEAVLRIVLTRLFSLLPSTRWRVT